MAFENCPSDRPTDAPNQHGIASCRTYQTAKQGSSQFLKGDVLAVENLFPNYLGCTGIDSNRLQAEAAEAAQAAWARTVAANERNEREADARRNTIKKRDEVVPHGCVFAKSCTLPDGTINYIRESGAIPTDPISRYGEFALLGGRETDEQGNIPLKRISGALPASLGTLLLGGAAATAIGVSCGGLCTAGAVASGAATGVAAGALTGVVALLWPSSLGDSSLYTEEQLQSLKHARTRARLHDPPIKANYEMAKHHSPKDQNTTVKTLATKSITLKTFSMAARCTT